MFSWDGVKMFWNLFEETDISSNLEVLRRICFHLLLQIIQLCLLSHELIL